MNSRIERLMEKRGVKDASSLTSEERALVKGWEASLSRPDLTVPDVAAFCRERIAFIEKAWADTKVPSEERLRLIDQHSVYRAILTAIDGPRQEREEMERWLIAQTSC